MGVVVSRFVDEVERLRNGRELSPADVAAVEAVAGINLRLRDARRQIEDEGLIIDDGKGFPIEHPALMIEKRCSAELRGWVKDRPDLFGEVKRRGGAGAKKPSRPTFKIV